MKYIVSKLLILSLFLSLGSCQDKTVVPPAKKNENLISVGVFDGNGAGAVSVIETIEALKIDKNIKAIAVSASDIMSGELDELDAFIFPGGSGSKQLNNLGDLGKEKIEKFVKEEGKGLIGICAGAYMLCQTEGYPSLQFASVKHIDRPHYDRGRGLVEFKLGENGLAIFPELKDKPQFLQYYDGPVMESLGTSKTYMELAQYVTDIHPHKGYPSNITPGKVFIYNEELGKGRIFGIAGHAESTPGMRWMIPRMARWVTKTNTIPYNAKWINPERYDKPILFDKATSQFEKSMWWKLVSNDEIAKLQAMDTLFALRSRPAVRWNVGLLRDKNAKVRANAASLLAKAEYTDAVKDLKSSLSVEQDSEAKVAIENALRFLDK